MNKILKFLLLTTFFCYYNSYSQSIKKSSADILNMEELNGEEIDISKRRISQISITNISNNNEIPDIKIQKLETLDENHPLLKSLISKNRTSKIQHNNAIELENNNELLKKLGFNNIYINTTDNN